MHKTAVLLQVRKMQKSLNSVFRQVLQDPLQKGHFTTENAPKTRFVTLGAFWFIFWSRCLQTLSHKFRSFDRIL